jgi:hypothetical protein
MALCSYGAEKMSVTLHSCTLIIQSGETMFVGIGKSANDGIGLLAEYKQDRGDDHEDR